MFLSDKDVNQGLECCAVGIEFKNCKECPYSRFKTRFISSMKCNDYLMFDVKELFQRKYIFEKEGMK